VKNGLKGLLGVFTPKKGRVKAMGDAWRGSQGSPWRKLKALASAKANKPSVHFSSHQIALCVRPCFLQDKNVIPTNCGKGGSVDHQCAQPNCVNPMHVLPAVEHITNIRRIGCPGGRLITHGRVICSFEPCEHALVGPDGQTNPLTGCTFFVHIDLERLFGGLIFSDPDVQAAFANAKAMCE